MVGGGWGWGGLAIVCQDDKGGSAAGGYTFSVNKLQTGRSAQYAVVGVCYGVECSQLISYRFHKQAIRRHWSL